MTHTHTQDTLSRPDPSPSPRRQVAEFEALASPSQSPSLRSPRDSSPADVDSPADGASPRRVSGYRLAANALVEQRVRRARLCNSHSPEAQDEEAEELGV